MDQVQLKD